MNEPSLFRRSPEREAVFGVLAVLWVGLAAARSLRIEITITGVVVLAVGYFTL
ncbi:hypothetical protein [Halovenus sp. HT40]|uniref:hypothetical protein n=1 Tax=Halovenus sp. HT40 TaxID=3126691 RepID=UPI00300F4FF9